LSSAAVGPGSSESLVTIAAAKVVSDAILIPISETNPQTIGVGAMSAGYDATGWEITYGATATFDFNTSIGSLDLNLLPDNFVDTSAGIAFDNMSLQIDVKGVPKVTKTFLSLTGSGGAQTYFSGQPVIGLGAIAANTPIEIEYSLGYNSSTSAAVGDGFGFTYELVDPPLSATVPEPSTWAMMLVGFAGLTWVGYRARGSPRLSRH
jgi:hypothetical protein